MSDTTLDQDLNRLLAETFVKLGAVGAVVMFPDDGGTLRVHVLKSPHLTDAQFLGTLSATLDDAVSDAKRGPLGEEIGS